MTTSPDADTVAGDALPLVSVVMPAFNAERYLREAIDSVLAQTHRPLELIVVDDGSTDATADVMASYGARIIAVDGLENRGIGAARNRGIAEARGSFIAFMDADDIWPADKLARQLAVLAADPALDLSFGHLQCFISPELPEDVKALRHCPPDPLPAFVAATMLARRASFDRVGLFDPSLRVGEFIDWYARARDAGLRSHLHGDIFLMRRIHETNTGVTQRTSYRD
jgi:glycosyltransferase involved in cell wall biosynthesis